MVKSTLVNTGQHWSVLSLKFQPVLSLKFSASCHTCEEEREIAPSCTNQSREKREMKWCDEWCPNEERGHYYLYNSLRGEETHPLSFLSLHFTETDLDNLCMREKKFKIPLLLVRMRWILYQNWTSRKEESNAIIISILWVVLRWNLALVANFNKCTPIWACHSKI